MQAKTLPLELLRSHPLNSNVMPADLLAKLIEHIRQTDRYPSIIVRPTDDEVYQILDGHHRVKALRELGRTEARCEVWAVDDDEAMLLLATLNRLQGQDDPRKRGQLLAKLAASASLRELADRLPEQQQQLERLLRFSEPMPAPRAPQPIGQMPQAVHFFLLPAQRKALEQRLRDVGGSREEALMQLVSEA